MSRVVSFFRHSAELLTGLMAVLGMWFFNGFLQDWFQAGSFDMVILVRPLYFLYVLFIMHAGLWLLWKIVYPAFASFLDVDMKGLFRSNELTLWQKVIVVTILWSAYLLLLGCLAMGGVMG